MILREEFRGDLEFWITSQPRIALRIMKLIEDVVRDPFGGIGKPEVLKHDHLKRWSRRITDEHRLVYEITSLGPAFYQARYHYGR
ncbi:MAG TPA: Txe/YoeB family addiction module toxin [Longimicrobium sp.]|uniref:Txe/YoeB family addiction module toxin n=1 Tax=Longimicrobium sp. TaxID=2029185 RepID=UPI002ED7C758